MARIEPAISLFLTYPHLVNSLEALLVSTVTISLIIDQSLFSKNDLSVEVSNILITCEVNANVDDSFIVL